MRKNMRNWSNNDKYVFADSSFYICFINELNQPDCYNFLDYYNFALGHKVLSEIENQITKNITEKIHICPNDNYNYDVLISPLLSNEEKNKEKGEFEIIGLSLYYLNFNNVKYIIIDDKKANKFAKKHFPELTEYLTGTIGLIKYCSYDGFISPTTSINILEDIKYAIENHDESRGNFICSLGKNSYKKIINKVIDELMEENNG